MTTKKRRNGHGAFSLLELVIVTVIIAIIAAVAIPRMSRGSKGAGDAALIGDLAVLRNAIEMFVAEHHGHYPSESAIANQLTRYTDFFGDAKATMDTTHIYGPYLRKIPPLPVGKRKGTTDIAANSAVGVGWVYDETTGSIRANTFPGEKDDLGRLYSDY